MKEGAPAIHHGILLNEGDGSPWSYLAEPDLLERVDLGDGRTSVFGAHAYRIVEIKNTAHLSSQHFAQIAMNAWLLEEVQGVSTEHCLMDHHGIKTPFLFSEHRYFFEHLLAACRETLGSKSEPIFLAKPICPGCAWENLCFSEAVKRGDPGLIHAISEKEIAMLKQAGLLSLAAVAEMTEPAAAEKGSGEILSRIPPDRRFVFASRALALGSGEVTRLKLRTGARAGGEIWYAHAERDLAHSKNWISFSTLHLSAEHKEGKWKHVVGGVAGEELRAFLRSTPLSSVRFLRARDLEEVKEEILFPEAFSKGEDLQHLSSVEDLAMEAFALDFPGSDLLAVLKRFGFLEPDFVEPILVYYEKGGGESFEAHLSELLMAVSKLDELIFSSRLPILPKSKPLSELYVVPGTV
ncbi:MAG: hypothetical protein JNM63_07465 [Spirochaetia bacterium]|nr:hypothetical protein [Spirochaetia bacterium]